MSSAGVYGGLKGLGDLPINHHFYASERGFSTRLAVKITRRTDNKASVYLHCYVFAAWQYINK